MGVRVCIYACARAHVCISPAHMYACFFVGARNARAHTGAWFHFGLGLGLLLTGTHSQHRSGVVGYVSRQHEAQDECSTDTHKWHVQGIRAVIDLERQ